ncbi:S-adenosylmethionine decarboxylase [Halobaculum rubrum]|uniref:S-adenosylmethionine decarboxylase n=1 Tax=Halobaculum rubrum TaxID=2872158 RepID=UPI001CA42800|nr:S-adenosylmethionine decarboxylase [Halobaculum rubrum]QZY01170.1 S-adenosylmethionine decarboxylase [Halobaculum rubrum]
MAHQSSAPDAGSAMEAPTGPSVPDGEWTRPEMYRAVIELEAPSAALDDLAAVRQLVDDVVERFGFTLLQYEAVDFAPIGVTGFGVIGESHISVHTWPEHRYAHVELLTCTDLPDAETLRERFPLPDEYLVEVRRSEP